jgi:predicted nucleic acid-binding protein
LIGLDTSVVVRYLVGTPAAQARRAARLIDDDATDCGVSIVALAECAHVLKTQYEVAQLDIIEALIGFVQRANVHVVDLPADVLVETLVRARDLPGRPIPDALIVAASSAAGALPLATFDRGQRRYGIETRDP